MRDVAGNPDALQQLQDGLANAWSTAEDAEVEELYDRLEATLPSDTIAEFPATLAYERDVIDAAITEIAPAVAAMLEQAIAKRLPWTWEPER